MIKLRNLIKEEYSTAYYNAALKIALKKLLPYVLVKGNSIMASTHQPKSEPAVRIDSKFKPTAIWVTTKMDSNGVMHIAFKTLVNNKENNLPKYGEKLANTVIGLAKEQLQKDPNFKFVIDIDQDVSGGFWKRYVEKHKDVEFNFVNS